MLTLLLFTAFLPAPEPLPWTLMVATESRGLLVWQSRKFPSAQECEETRTLLALSPTVADAYCERDSITA